MCVTDDLVILFVDTYLKAMKTHIVTKAYGSIFPEVLLVIIKTCQQCRCFFQETNKQIKFRHCLLYTSDAADEDSPV